MILSTAVNGTVKVVGLDSGSPYMNGREWADHRLIRSKKHKSRMKTPTVESRPDGLFGDGLKESNHKTP